MKGGKRGAHPSYKVMSGFKRKNQGPWRPGKKWGHTFDPRGNRVATKNAYKGTAER